MKNLIYLLVLSLTLNVNAQDFKEYYVVVKEGKSIEPTSKTALPNGTLSMVFQDEQQHFQSFFDNKDVYFFEKAFPTAQTSLLQRTYITRVNNSVSLEQIENFPEIQAIGENPKPILLFEPNDYDLSLPNSTPSTASQLDLIRAPLAWEIRQGNDFAVVGIVDTPVNIYHEDLENKIIDYYGVVSTGWSHGTAVAGCVASDTDNGLGISAIGNKTKMIISGNLLSNLNGLNADQQMFFLSQQPNVKVVNGSWYNRCNPDPTGVQQTVYEEIWNNGVLPVFAAGNGPQCGGPTNKVYPASYYHVLSVTSVGHLHEYGTPWGNTTDVTPKDLHIFYDDAYNTVRSHHHNDAVDICAPGYNITTTQATGYAGGSGMNGTSFAAPIVAGAAALVYSQFPDFTAQQVHDILKETADDIYWIPENQQYIGKLGTGRLNAYRAVLTAKCMMGNSDAHVTDLMIKDTRRDIGNEPNENSSIFWESTDIWVRNSNDGQLYQVHQNPEYSERVPNYIYVRVTNRRCRTSSGGDRLYVNWAKAGTSLNWPENWDGSLNIDGVALGGLVGVGSIPPLKPGQEAIIEIPWMVPNPDDFIGISPEAYTFSLLARIESLDDPLSSPLVSNINLNVLNNNNLALKNIKIVNFEPGILNPIGGEVIVGNTTNQTNLYNLELVKETNEGGKAIFDEAEVNLKMDETLFNAWERGGKLAEKLKNTDDETKKIVTGNNVLFKNILFEPNEFGILNVTFNFLTQELTDKENYIYRIIQRDANTNEIIGGQTFEIRKKTNQFFTANAGDDKTIEKFENVTLSAETISDLHIYNWYDAEGNLIYTGKDLTISPEITQKYKLEVISTLDGFKDYDEIEVKVNPYSLHDLLPNPVSDELNISYSASGANSAYLMLISSNNGTSDNYIINVSEENKQIDVSNYPSGLYFVSLICNGVLVDSKNLIIE